MHGLTHRLMIGTTARTGVQRHHYFVAERLARRYVFRRKRFTSISHTYMSFLCDPTASGMEENKVSTCGLYDREGVSTDDTSLYWVGIQRW